MQDWLALNELGKAPPSGAIPRLTWKQSTKNLLDVLLSGSFYRQWMPDGSMRFRGNDHRLHTLVGKRVGRALTTTGQAGYLLFGPYAPLAAGAYRAWLHLTVGVGNCTGSYADVVMDRVQQELGTAAVKSREPGDELIEIGFSVIGPCTDFEVRLWVTDQSDLAVSKVEIEPGQAIDSPENLANSSGSDDLSVADEVNSLQPTPLKTAKQ